MAEDDTPTITLASSGKNVVARVPHQDFRSWFYLVTGKPDSKVKLFQRSVVVAPSDLEDLNERVVTKLNNHQITDSITTVTVTFDKKEAVQFGTWPEFLDFNWKVPERTQEVTVKWNFCLDLPQFDVPQPHMLLMKLSKPVTPKQFLQMIFSSSDEDIDGLQPDTAICMCRVDFINHVLADELITIVDRWNDSLKKHPSQDNWLDKLEKHDGLIAQCVHYAFALVFVLIAGLGLYQLTKHIDPTSPITIDGLRLSFYWLLGTGAIVFLLGRIGKYLAAQIYGAINAYGERTVFDFTRGDSNHVTEVDNKNAKSMRRFFILTSISIGITAAEAITCWFLLP
ncbi:hypothetical protein [Rhodopirellula sp. SWK7]|uniref:hypothetical protein n=1 Tax=Rhodopirellula sp. SWK7 TaxID=595460 RepID=UPI0002BECA35|nr:hypothetical protein [Rhodopirellula sp. SWK7]EMI44000.1 putative membrane protein [Rhodopirellula sp. SWK7]